MKCTKSQYTDLISLQFIGYEHVRRNERTIILYLLHTLHLVTQLYIKHIGWIYLYIIMKNSQAKAF